MSRARVGFVLLLSLLTLPACSGELDDEADGLAVAEQAIFYGTRSPGLTNLSSGEERAIGYIADAGGAPFCTATLIDRDTAITARHCVEGTIAVEDMRFGLGDPNNPDALIQVHSAPFHNSLDAALLFLSEDAVNRVPGVEPIAFNRTQPSSALVGTELEAAGYGQTHDDSTGLYYVRVELTEIQNDFLVVNGWGQRGICFGDSGGPLFIHVGNGEPVIAGVESHGDSSCVDQDFETRLDQATSWIDAEMAAFDPNDPPDTGVQGDIFECGDSSGTSPILPAGQEGKCFGLGLCSAGVTRANPTWFAPLGLALMLLAVRRRRRQAAAC